MTHDRGGIMKETIARLRELEKNATKVPWGNDIASHQDSGFYYVARAVGMEHFGNEVGEFKKVQGLAQNDADLIAETRNALPRLLDYIDGLQEVIRKDERREDEHCRQIERLTKDNALLLAAATKALIGGNHLANVLIGRLGGGGWQDETTEGAMKRWGETTDTYDVFIGWKSMMELSKVVEAAEAAMETKPESLYPSNDVMYTKGEG